MNRGDAQVGQVAFGAFAYFGAAFAGEAGEELGGAAEEGDFLVRVCGCDFACIIKWKLADASDTESEVTHRLFPPLPGHRRR